MPGPWFAEVELDGVSPSVRRGFDVLVELLDRLDPTNLVPSRQTARDHRGAALVQLVHAYAPEANLEISLTGGASLIFGLYGHDEDFAHHEHPDEAWEADFIDTMGGLLQGQYEIEHLTFGARPYRTLVTDLVGEARATVTMNTFLALLPVPRRFLTSTTRTVDYGCRSPGASV